MNTKRQSQKKRSPLVVILLLLIAGVGYLFTQGYLDDYLPGEEKVATSSLEPSEDPQRHITMAQQVLQDLPREERCSRNTNDPTADCYAPEYDREAQFGDAWVDVDQDGCGTREQVLARDMQDVTQESDCYVSSGVLEDPYTGQTIDDRSAVDIDHIISLSHAWDAGAHEWTQGKRVAFANDTEINLIAVDGATNQQDKKDKTLAEWEPSTDYTCTFTIKYIWALDAYDLPITPDDYDVASNNLDSCDVVYGEPTDAEPLDESVQQYAEQF